MTSTKHAANSVGGKTARACDSCIRKRARWYCAADDAFLCQSCDSLVHSANQLARRHERLRLKTASLKSSSSSSSSDVLVLAAMDLSLAPSWHRGITKKARTPRHGKNNQSSAALETPRGRYEPARNPFHLVPEVGSDEYSNSHDENEEQLLYRVPIFDPLVTELCTPPYSLTSAKTATTAATPGRNQTDNKETKQAESKVSSANKSNSGVDNLHGFLPTETELAQFAADVESLLGRGLDNECIGMDDLGLIDTKEKESRECCADSEKVKVEDEESPCKVETTSEMEMEIREPFELNFDYDSPATREQADEEEKKVDLVMANEIRNNEGELRENSNQRKKKKILLQLDYEAVISAWACQKSPWTNGGKPDFDPDDCWPECMGTCGLELHQPYYGEMGTYGCHAGIGDGGREARVSRYREKRRTRLFSKKIRYEVRKLNAEKRPRMKGRFVKRASFTVPAPSSFPLLSK
ncbi:zinc finger protein CONSTANS-LIKE 16-like isoform X2 [Prosopis cineraria]|uniref:zinc finger protein CONSTANS-LIKE 16-like isoform X2 n=1 Tax=Prosopis cineraria TaxID=364024 RepID=UPI00241090F8|nr:zinc finger protein CONSTANS-LIKE 16-like isoform X2 [Prosopis cineraria]